MRLFWRRPAVVTGLGLSRPTPAELAKRDGEMERKFQQLYRDRVLCYSQAKFRTSIMGPRPAGSLTLSGYVEGREALARDKSLAVLWFPPEAFTGRRCQLNDLDTFEALLDASGDPAKLRPLLERLQKHALD